MIPFTAIWAGLGLERSLARLATGIFSFDPLRTMQPLGGHPVDTCSSSGCDYTHRSESQLPFAIAPHAAA
jgi:hypothetical protein